MNLNPELFVGYPKIPRLGNVLMTVTEKIDGTNGFIAVRDGAIACVGSRKRVVIPNNDNFGFAEWVYANAEALAAFLGNGNHYGEWAGPGIQRNPLRLSHRTFFLFNVQAHPLEKFANVAHPHALSRVPLLRSEALFDPAVIEADLAEVRNCTFVPAARRRAPSPPGEGVVVSVLGQKLKLTPDRGGKGPR